MSLSLNNNYLFPEREDEIKETRNTPSLALS